MQGFALLTSHSNPLWVKEKGLLELSLNIVWILQSLSSTYPGVQRRGARPSLPLCSSHLCHSSEIKGNWVGPGMREGNPGGGTAHSQALTHWLAHHSLPCDVLAATWLFSLPPAPSAAAASTSQLTCLSKLHGCPSHRDEHWEQGHNLPWGLCRLCSANTFLKWFCSLVPL